MKKVIVLFLFIRLAFGLQFIHRNVFSNESRLIEDYDEYESELEERSNGTNCSKSYTADEGEILSPNYPNSYPDDITCEWDITVSPNMSILLMVNDLNLRLYDRINVYDGPDKEHKIIGRHSKYLYSLNQNTVSSGNQLFLAFHSKKHYYSTQVKEFKIKYKAVKQGCGLVFNDTEGTITSPGYPDYYPNNLKCSWTITTASDTNIIIMFDDFDLGDGQAVLQLGYFKSFKGNSIPSNFMSEMNYLKLELNTGLNVNGRGFKLRYRSKDWAKDLKFLIFASNAIIKTEHNESKTVVINGHKKSKLTAYDLRKDTIIWFDSESDQVHIKFTNNNTKTIQMNGRPNSLSLDYSNDLIYWIDIQTKAIKVMDIRDVNKTIYVISELVNENPRDLIINAKKSALIWSDVGFDPKIMCSKLDGSEQSILYSNSRQAIHLTIDYQRERYYFIDISDHSLYSIDFEGKNETFYQKSTKFFDSVNKMSVLNNDLYLATDYMIYRLPEIDLRLESIQILYKIHRYVPSITHIDKSIDIDRQWINSFELINETIQPIVDHNQHLCPTNGCSHLCLSNGHSFRCLTPNNNITQNVIQVSFLRTDNNSVAHQVSSVQAHQDTTNKLSIVNTFLIFLVIAFNGVGCYILFRFVYKTKIYEKLSSETRLPLEGIENNVLTRDRAKSKDNLLDFEINSTV